MQFVPSEGTSLASETKPESEKHTARVVAKSRQKLKRGRTARKPKSAKRATRGPAKTARTRPQPAAPARATRKPRARRKQSTKAERARILAAADREGLTAPQVQKRFGVKPVTYYSWRKASKGRGTVSRGAIAGAVAGVSLVDEVRAALRAQIASLLPEIVREEVEAALLGRIPRRR